MENIFQTTVLGCSYGLLFLLCRWVWKRRSERLVSVKLMRGSWYLLHLRHTAGAIIMNVIPAIFLPNLPKHLLDWPGDISWLKSFLLATMIGILLSAGLSHRDDLPIEIDQHKNPSSHALIHIVTRSAFLVSYEWFFRGIILFSCVETYGVSAAILINLALYAFIHIFNGKKELLGSIPFGLILCVFTLWYHSVWPAAVLHLVLSFSYESFLLSRLFKKSKIIL